jgi:hypothetical protein
MQYTYFDGANKQKKLQFHGNNPLVEVSGGPPGGHGGKSNGLVKLGYVLLQLMRCSTLILMKQIK